MKRSILYLFSAILFLGSCAKEPYADFLVSKTVVSPGEIIYMTNRSYDAVRYEWDFDDGYLSSNYNVSHSWNNPGVYKVQLTAFGKGNKANVYYVNIEVVSTDLEVTVLEWDYEYPVPNASVILYSSIDDWINENDPLIEGFTNAQGKVLFTNLIPDKRYYIDVWEENHDNYTLAGENAIWITTDRLIFGMRNQFIAWVDYYETGKKSTANRKNVKQNVSNDEGNGEIRIKIKKE